MGIKTNSRTAPVTMASEDPDNSVLFGPSVLSQCGCYEVSGLYSSPMLLQSLIIFFVRTTSNALIRDGVALSLEYQHMFCKTKQSSSHFNLHFALLLPLNTLGCVTMYCVFFDFLPLLRRWLIVSSRNIWTLEQY